MKTAENPMLKIITLKGITGGWVCGIFDLLRLPQKFDT